MHSTMSEVTLSHREQQKDPLAAVIEEDFPGNY